MKKTLNRIKYYLLFIAGFCMVTSIAGAQDVSHSDLAQQFVSYQTNNYNEKIFVHTDKTFYLTGESIWFKVYCTDEAMHKPSALSRIAYVEILDKENKPLLQAKISLDSGSGNGSFIIPSFVNSGNYILRAYTKWMENFDAGYFFEQAITIVNNLKSFPVQQAGQQTSYAISFFPEGGNLVEGIASVVAFKAVNFFGEPADCDGNIVDDRNNIVTSFRAAKFGMGNFIFTPGAGKTYKAVVRFGDTSIEKELPPVYKQGYVMRLEDADTARIRITLTSNVSDSGPVYLLAHSQNVMKDFKQGKLSSGSTVFTIDKNKLSEGISDITIFNGDKQPVCERLYFKKPLSNLNIRLQPDKTSYQPRREVNISLNTATRSPADMSVSVFMIDSLQPGNYNDIFSYLLLSSELKGSITSPQYYFQNNTPEANEAADNLMLTQGWRRFKWEDVLADKKPYLEFLPEYEGMIINGKATGRYNSLPAGNVFATLTVPGTNFQLVNAISNASGNFLFNTRNFYGTNNIILQADSNYRIDILSPYSNKSFSGNLPVFKMPLQWKNQLLFRSINAQAENAYLIDKKQHAYAYDAADTSSFYGKPDKRYYLDDYTRFITMEEVMREYVAEVKPRKDGQQFHFKVLDFLTQTYFDNDPLILLDGLPVSNPNRIIEFDPLKIKRLDVIGSRYYYGNMVSSGILSYSTYEGDLAGFPLTAEDVVIRFDGLQREREFYSPVYDNDAQLKNHLPDLRNVLYWNAKIKTGDSGKTNFNFYTSDVEGKYACVVQGITRDGVAGSSIIFFDVVH